MNLMNSKTRSPGVSWLRPQRGSLISPTIPDLLNTKSPAGNQGEFHIYRAFSVENPGNSGHLTRLMSGSLCHIVIFNANFIISNTRFIILSGTYQGFSMLIWPWLTSARVSVLHTNSSFFNKKSSFFNQNDSSSSYLCWSRPPPSATGSGWTSRPAPAREGSLYHSRCSRCPRPRRNRPHRVGCRRRWAAEYLKMMNYALKIKMMNYVSEMMTFVFKW